MYLYKFYLINLVLKIFYLIKSPLSLFIANYQLQSLKLNKL